MPERKSLYNFPQKPGIFEQKGFSRILSTLPPQISDIFGKSINLQHAQSMTQPQEETISGNFSKFKILYVLMISKISFMYNVMSVYSRNCNYVMPSLADLLISLSNFHSHTFGNI